MKILIIAPFILLFSITNAYSQNPPFSYSEDSLTILYAEYHYLYEVGLEIHKKYDDKIKADPIQLRYCLGEYNYLQERAKAAIGMAGRLPSPNSEEYLQTGWKTLECISCKGKVSACNAIPPTLKKMTEEYKAQKK